MTQLMETLRTNDSLWARTLRVFLPVSEEAEAAEATEYKGLHPVLLLGLSPVIGLLFLMFLPFVGFGMLAWLGARALTGGGASRTEVGETPRTPQS